MKVTRSERQKKDDKLYNAKRKNVYWNATLNMKKQEDIDFNEQLKKELDKTGMSRAEFVKKALKAFIN